MANDNNSSCACSSAPKLIFPCSGASDTGEITDRAARKLTKEGAGKMFCLAGIGGRVSGIMASTQSAAKILVIDGCPLHCARKTLEEAGFMEFEHLRLADLGLEKGKSPVCDEWIEKVAAQGRSFLNG
ncbi:MAG: putative zinc-binding protein [bacterium]|nr:putative zinc-binding protein [bacterium]